MAHQLLDELQHNAWRVGMTLNDHEALKTLDEHEPSEISDVACIVQHLSLYQLLSQEETVDGSAKAGNLASQPLSHQMKLLTHVRHPCKLLLYF